MATKSRHDELKLQSQAPSKSNVARWLALGTMGLLLALVVAFVVERTVAPNTTTSSAGQVTALDARSVSGEGSEAVVNGELHEPQDLARAEAGQLGQPALVWFGAAW